MKNVYSGLSQSMKLTFLEINQDLRLVKSALIISLTTRGYALAVTSESTLGVNQRNVGFLGDLCASYALKRWTVPE